MDEPLKNWWECDKDDLPAAIEAVISHLDSEQGYRSSANLRNLRMYSNLAVIGLGSSEYTSDESSLPPNRLTLNVVESVVETAKALISTNRPKVRYLTEGGSYKERKRAECLTRFVGGQFYGANIYEKAQDAFSDAAVFGTGFLKVHNDGEDVICERVFTDEVLIDDLEGKYGAPRSLYHHQEVERSVLKAEYDLEELEVNESGVMRQNGSFHSGMADPISVVEAWHLPSAKGAGDGRHTISTSNINIVDEEWTLDRFPIAVFRWAKRPLGFWGKGIPEQLRGIQIEINMILQKTQRLMNLASSKVFVQKGSKVNKKKLDNEEWGVVEYWGDHPPVFATVAAISPEYAVQLERLYRMAFEVTGISQLAAQSKLPQGLDKASGRAVMEYNDLQTQRFLLTGQAWEGFFLNISDLMIDNAKILYGRNKNYGVMTENGDILEKIKWSEVDPGKAKYRRKSWPVSLLPDHPAGKLQTIQTLIQIDPRMQPYVSKLLDYPDLKATLNRMNAPLMVTEKIIQQIMDGGEVIPPSPFIDLRAGITEMQYAYNEALTQDVEKEILDKMVGWMEEARMLLESQVEQQMAAAQAAEMAQSAQGMPFGETGAAAPAEAQSVQSPGSGGAPVEAMTGY